MLDMPRSVFEQVLAFLQRSRIPDARLLGGEPTEHPAFSEYVARALDLGFVVTVFTGGLIPEGALECMRRISPERLRVVLNTAIPGKDPDAWVRMQSHVCRELGSRVELGLTLTSAAQDPGFLLPRIDQGGLRRSVRLGVAHPVWGGTNVSLRPQTARLLGRTLEAFLCAAETVGVKVAFDCGFTPCMFSRSFLEAHPDLFETIGLRCNAIVDVLPEGEVIACYALSRAWRLPLTDIDTRDSLAAVLDGEMGSLLPWGAYRDCAFCEYMSKGLCVGGCRARRAVRARPDVSRLLREDGQEFRCP